MRETCLKELNISGKKEHFSEIELVTKTPVLKKDYGQLSSKVLLYSYVVRFLLFLHNSISIEQCVLPNVNEWEEQWDELNV